MTVPRTSWPTKAPKEPLVWLMPLSWIMDDTLMDNS